MNIFLKLCFVTLLSSLVMTKAVAASDQQVSVEEIPVNQSSNAEKAEELWQQTKTKTGAAASSAVEYGKVQGTRAASATKKGVVKGKDAVVAGSKQAWESTKDVSGKVADYTVEQAKQVKKSVEQVFEGGQSSAPISDKSPSKQATE